jgi:urease accessory protein
MTATALARDDPSWYTPARLPDELAACDDRMEGGLTVGAPGKVGLLELGLVRRGGVTRVEHQYQRAPLHVYRPIQLDANRPDMAFIFLQQFGEGFVHGDRCRIDIDCGPGTAVHVTTLAATNVYRADRNFATQLVNLHVGYGAILEYLPGALVPFRASRLFQRTCLTADPDSTVIFGELLLPGRVARGERHAYELFWAETEACDAGGNLLFADVLRIAPREANGPSSIGILGGHDVVATLYVVTQLQPASSLVDQLRRELDRETDVLAGVSELPHGCGAVVRLLGPTSKLVAAALRNAWSAVRVPLIGAPAPELRKG